MVKLDYLMRTVQQLAHTLAALLGGARGRTLAESRTRLDTISATFTGLDLGTLKAFSYADLHAVLAAGGTLAVERAFAAGRVLQADAELAAERDAGPGRAQVMTAFRLLAEVADDVGGFVDEHHERGLLFLHDALRGDLGSPEVARQAFRAWRLTRHLDRAEEALFEWIALDARARSTAESFYRALLALPDRELEARRLPRHEVHEGMRELRLGSR